MVALLSSSRKPAALLLLFVLFCAVDAAEWGYSGQYGPQNWLNSYPVCGGNAQSPINIGNECDKRHDGPRPNSPRPIWKNYDLKPDGMTMKNNGHSLVLTAKYSSDAVKPQIQLGTDKTYVLENVHFHWGKRNYEGSEHAFLNRNFALEMHAVHLRVVNGVKTNEIAVLGYLFQISWLKDSGLEKFINFAPKVQNAATEYEHPTPFAWSSLISRIDHSFFTYNGSLTTPPCAEVVTWIVRKELGRVSESQIKLFRLLLNDKGEQMAGNFRPLQPRNGRQVLCVRK